jgi:hypothetical protein
MEGIPIRPADMADKVGLAPVASAAAADAVAITSGSVRASAAGGLTKRRRMTAHRYESTAENMIVRLQRLPDPF